ncbi:MAG: CocE/NonD family hydrolase [Pseudomonadota bacterium]
MPKFFTPVLLVCAFVALSATEAATEDPGRSDADVRLDWGVKIPLAEEIGLGATLYRPIDSGDQRLTTIVTITPYISDRYHPDALYFARSGFAFLIVDTRGRGNSEGEFLPLGIEDGTDGAQVVQWVAEQPWSNGKVALRGGSYGGYNQWATARYFPEALKTIVPIAAPYHGIDFPMNLNVQYPYTIRWLTLTSGVTPQGRMFGDSNFWQQKFRAYHREGIAFTELARLVGNNHPQFLEWASHPQQDDYWAARVPTEDQYKKLDLPILTITGYYDGDQPGAMEYYRRHMRSADRKARDQHYLLLGPWDHGGTRFPRQTFGGYTFGDAMMFDAFQLDRDWYRWAMDDGEFPDFLKDRVTYFVAGANTWKSAPSLEEISSETQTLYLQSDGSADRPFGGGELAVQAPGDASVDQYVYDPLDVTKALRTPAEDYILDQTEVMLTEGDGLIYHSARFAEPLEISGYITFEGWFELDVPDTDINVTLYEVRADGSSVALTGQPMRVRYRNGLDEAEPFSPGSVERLVFDQFYFFSRQVAKDSRLRLFIRPANNVEQQRNYNSGKVVAQETRADARVATVRLHAGAGRGSRLVLPVVREANP